MIDVLWPQGYQQAEGQKIRKITANGIDDVE
jgi:hypothetical protein